MKSKNYTIDRDTWHKILPTLEPEIVSRLKFNHTSNL
jgi:hypothetical protein